MLRFLLMRDEDHFVHVNGIIIIKLIKCKLYILLNVVYIGI